MTAPSGGAPEAVDHAVPDDTPAPDGKRSGPARPCLVLGWDRTPASRGALVVAADLAVRLGAHLHAVHVVDLNDYPVDPELPGWEAEADETLSRERHEVETELGQYRCAWTYHAARGEPVSALTGVADACDALMIVVGTRGEGLSGWIQRLLTASVSHGLIRRQGRPVLVVPRQRPTDPAAAADASAP